MYKFNILFFYGYVAPKDMKLCTFLCIAKKNTNYKAYGP